MSIAARTTHARRVLAVAALLPSIGLFAAWNARTPWLLRPPHTLSEAVPALFAARIADAGGRSWLVDMGTRFEGLPIHLLRGFRDGSDRIASVAILILVAVHALAAMGPARRHPLAWARPCLLGVALAGYLLLPHHFDSYEAMSVAPRLAPLVLAAAIAAVPARTEPTRVQPWLRGAVLAVGVAYGAVLVREYRAFASEVAEFDSVVDRVPPGGRVVGLVFDGNSRVVDIDDVFRGLPSLYVALRPAPSSMVALRYCGMRHFPCVPRTASPPAPDPWTPERLDTAAALAFFDYFIVRGSAAAVLPKDGVVEIARSGAWAAYRRDR